jgi:hypothetical protein
VLGLAGADSVLAAAAGLGLGRRLGVRRGLAVATAGHAGDRRHRAAVAGEVLLALGLEVGLVPAAAPLRRKAAAEICLVSAGLPQTGQIVAAGSDMRWLISDRVSQAVQKYS